ncbi:CorA family divalent cation transporter [Stappia stellulata]|uniref:CorA family divalent cation transporter n=1 Tax=Stappia stellulata TaxID=71235 RepID=UPI0003FC67D0|nr:CorA family divalent cation transporter [Stappia stellulata]
MMTAYIREGAGLRPDARQAGAPVPADTVWLDLVLPDADERHAASAWIGAPVPSGEDIAAIETSERLYETNGALVMTAVLSLIARDPDPRVSTLKLVATPERIVTIRQSDALSVELAARRLASRMVQGATGTDVLFILLDAVADRAADVIEEASAEFDAVSSSVFGKGIDSRKAASYKATIKQIGEIGLKVARMHDCCASLERLFVFLTLHAKTLRLTGPQRSQCKALGRDIRSIREHANALDAKLNFLLDATVGLVNLEQNQIIKIFSVLAVVFLPPTLIASIYGMNFEGMPELSWTYGYPFSILIMVASVLVTFMYFRWKKLL